MVAGTRTGTRSASRSAQEPATAAIKPIVVAGTHTGTRSKGSPPVRWIHLIGALLSFLCVLCGVGLGSHAVLELEELAEPYASKDLVPVIGQALSEDGMEM